MAPEWEIRYGGKIQLGLQTHGSEQAAEDFAQRLYDEGAASAPSGVIEVRCVEDGPDAPWRAFEVKVTMVPRFDVTEVPG